MPDNTTYYVTKEGLAAAVINPDIHRTIRGILAGRAHPSTVKAFERRQLIAKEAREAPRTDNNTLITTGAIERIREVLQAPNGNGNGHAPQPAADAPPAAAKAPTATRYVAVAPQGPKLSPSEQIIYEAIQRTGEATVADLRASDAKLAAMNLGTLRWAIQQLRRKGLLQSKAA